MDEQHVIVNLEERYRIGSRDAEGTALSNVAGIASNDSVVYVLESKPARIAKISLSGAWLGDVAREGEGPGELRAPAFISLRRGVLSIGDPQGGRLEEFSESGRPLRSYRWTVDADSLGTRASPIARLQDGTFLSGPSSIPIGGVVAGRVAHRTYYKTDSLGTPIGVLTRVGISEQDFIVAQMPLGGLIMGAHPLRDSPMVAVLPDGGGLVVIDRPEAVVADSARFGIRIVDYLGQSTLDVSVPYSPVAATGWIDQALGQVEEDMQSRSGTIDRGLIDAFRAGWGERHFYPPVTEVIAGVDHSIWLRREETSVDSVTWQIFSGAGKYWGETRTPKGRQLVSVSLQLAWAVEKDGLDVPFLVGYAVDRQR